MGLYVYIYSIWDLHGKCNDNGDGSRSGKLTLIGQFIHDLLIQNGDFS
jgi:hypothetical protein